MLAVKYHVTWDTVLAWPFERVMAMRQISITDAKYRQEEQKRLSK